MDGVQQLIDLDTASNLTDEDCKEIYDVFYNYISYYIPQTSKLSDDDMLLTMLSKDLPNDGKNFDIRDEEDSK